MEGLLYLLAFIIPLIAQIYVSATYKKNSKKDNAFGLTGYDVARKILDKNKLNDLYVVETKGTMTDHYDPTRKTIKLSTDVYHGKSVASLAIAAHECGHAIQDKTKYTPMRIRSALVPFVNICTRIGYLAIVIGIIFSYTLIEVGIVLLLSMLVFQLITLPVEFNASHRAIKELERLNLIDEEEKSSAKNMLIAAAFTYVASVLSTLLEILRYALIFNDRER